MIFGEIMKNYLNKLFLFLNRGAAHLRSLLTSISTQIANSIIKRFMIMYIPSKGILPVLGMLSDITPRINVIVIIFVRPTFN